MKTKNSGVALIATAVIAVLLFISSGCTQNTAVNAENEKFDGNISNRNLAIFHDGEYFFNLTDGIWKCSETFENIDRLTYGYCEYPFIKNKTLYWISPDEGVCSLETSPDGRYDAYIYERFSETSPKILYKLTVLRRGEELQLENDDICESYDLYGFEWIDGNTLSVDGGENTDITLLNTEISDINVLMPEKVGKVS